MQLPEILHKAVLAGTSRIPFDAANGVAAALRPLAGQGGDAGGLQLWHAVAAQDLWQRAGFQPAEGGAAPAAAGADAECPRAAEEMLHLLMRGIQAGLLPTWLSLAQARGVAVPHVCLVPLLEQAMARPALREKLQPVLGARGRWLIAQNPEWTAKFSAVADDAVALELAWNTGSPPQRAAALRAMRAADPSAALASLQSGWAQEPPENRAALLPALETGLSLADEPFLETALDDKRKEVRFAARELLSFLPGSQLSARCAARLDALFTLKPGAAGALPVLEVALPESCDKAMKRDGVGSENPHGMGEKQCWIFNMMQCVPPAHWVSRWGLALTEVMQVVDASDFRTSLKHGLMHAIGLSARAGAEHAVDWFGIVTADSHVLVRWAMFLPPAARENVLQTWLKSADGKGVPAALALTQHMANVGGAQLSPAVSRLLLGRMQQIVRDMQSPRYNTKAEFDAMAALLDTGELDYLEQGWPEPDWPHWDNWHQLVDGLKEALRFRNALQRSFMEDKE
jgi:hypothetical protein